MTVIATRVKNMIAIVIVVVVAACLELLTVLLLTNHNGPLIAVGTVLFSRLHCCLPIPVGLVDLTLAFIRLLGLCCCSLEKLCSLPPTLAGESFCSLDEGTHAEC